MAGWITDAWFKLTTGKTASDIEAETAKNNAILAARDADLIQRGIWDKQAQQQHWENTQRETYAENTGGQIFEAAKEGAVEGLDAMQTAVKDTVTGATTFSLRSVFGFVPWWVWILGLGYVAFRLGLLTPALKALKIKLPAV